MTVGSATTDYKSTMIKTFIASYDEIAKSVIVKLRDGALRTRFDTMLTQGTPYIDVSLGVSYGNSVNSIYISSYKHITSEQFEQVVSRNEITFDVRYSPESDTCTLWAASPESAIDVQRTFDWKGVADVSIGFDRELRIVNLAFGAARVQVPFLLDHPRS